MPARLSIGAAAFGTVLVLLSACESLRSVVVLQRDLATRFDLPSARVTIVNGTTLNVLLADTSRATRPEPQRLLFCDSITAFIREHYREYERLTRVQVSFLGHRSSTGPLVSTAGCSYPVLHSGGQVPAE